MERGFLASGSKDRNKDEGMKETQTPLLNSLAALVKNIDGRILGKDGKPLKASRRNRCEDSVDTSEGMQHVNNSSGKEFGRSDSELKSILKRTSLIANVQSCLNSPAKHISFAAKEFVYDYVAATLVDSANESLGEQQEHVNKLTTMEDNPTAGTPSCKNIPTSFMDALNSAGKSGTGNGVSIRSDPPLVRFRQLVNRSAVKDSDCVLTKKVAALVKCKYENTLVGYFLGKTIAFQLVKNYVTNTWGKFGLLNLMKSDDGVFLFQFSSKEGLEQVMQRGPWMIRNSPILLSKWSPNLSLKKGEVNTVPVWVKMYNVPVLAYSGDGLSLIATKIGKLIMLDAFTSSMCVNPWGRISFARALIEISADATLKKEVVMAVENEEDNGHTREVIRVEYEWTPPHCLDGKLFGHDTNICPKRVREEVPKDPTRDEKTTTMEENDDGFTKVYSRKMKKKGADFGGIRLNKPKSKVMWQQKKGVENIASTSNTTKEGDKREATKVPSPARVNLESMTPVSNTFDVLNAIEVNVCDSSGQNPKVSDPSGTENGQEKESLLSRLRKVKEASRSSPKTSMSDSDESEVEEISPSGGSFFLDEVDLDCYDGYESQVLDIPNHMRQWCNAYDIRLR